MTGPWADWRPGPEVPYGATCGTREQLGCVPSTFNLSHAQSRQRVLSEGSGSGDADVDEAEWSIQSQMKELCSDKQEDAGNFGGISILVYTPTVYWVYGLP